MEKMIERLFKTGLVTTLIGTGIILISIVLLYTHKASITEIVGWLGLSLTFLRSKDTLIGINKDEE